MKRVLTVSVLALAAIGGRSQMQPVPSGLFNRLVESSASLKLSSTTHPKWGRILRGNASVEGTTAAIELYALPNDRLAMMVLKSAPVSSAAGISKDNLWRILIESEAYSPAHIAYNLNERRFEFRTPIAPTDVSPTTIQREWGRLQNMAKVTKAIWAR